MSISEQEKRPSPRPKQISYAVYFIISAVLFSALLQAAAAVTTWQDSAAYYANPLNLICLGVGHLVSIYIAIMIAAGKSWARILFVVGFTLRAINVVMGFGATGDNPLVVSLVVFSTGLEVIAILLLYRPVSSAWFQEHKAFEAGQKEGVKEEDSASGLVLDSSGRGDAAGDEFQVAKVVAAAGGIGALIGLLNGLFWAVSLPPQSDAERGLIVFLIAAGILLGGGLGAILGFTSLQIARGRSDRDPVRWALYGGVLGGLFAFGCGFLAMVMSFG